ncbi:hypothetical protein PSH14_11755 [Enterococcus mundtii]|nr:putative holin-like toxin [Enterococcus mundtii]MDB7101205.1 hypothetical protein [Enterococcus mundtii]MDV7745746.1 hypothetical protein [Enterococcus mundtii]
MFTITLITLVVALLSDDKKK